jgi:chaperonin cofactor prefoldin
MIEELTLSRAECMELKNEIQRLQKRMENESARSEALQAKITDAFSQVSLSENV